MLSMERIVTTKNIFEDMAEVISVTKSRRLLSANKDFSTRSWFEKKKKEIVGKDPRKREGGGGY